MAYHFYDKPRVIKFNVEDWPDSCEHVYQGALIAGSYTETDSFGPVVRCYMCAECAQQAKEANSWLECEWCGKEDQTVGTQKSLDSSDYLCICAKCYQEYIKVK